MRTVPYLWFCSSAPVVTIRPREIRYYSCLRVRVHICVTLIHIHIGLLVWSNLQHCMVAEKSGAINEQAMQMVTMVTSQATNK